MSDRRNRRPIEDNNRGRHGNDRGSSSNSDRSSAPSLSELVDNQLIRANRLDSLDRSIANRETVWETYKSNLANERDEKLQKSQEKYETQSDKIANSNKSSERMTRAWDKAEQDYISRNTKINERYQNQLRTATRETTALWQWQDTQRQALHDQYVQGNEQLRSIREAFATRTPSPSNDVMRWDN